VNAIPNSESISPSRARATVQAFSSKRDSPASTGRSFYHGYAGNYATISWNEFDHHMASIFKQ